MYNSCRSGIREIIKVIGVARCNKNVVDLLLALNNAFMFVHEFIVVDLPVS